MKTKLYGVLIVLIAGVFAVTIGKKIQQNQYLKNLNIAFHDGDKSTQSIHGALEYYNMIKADPTTGKIDHLLVEQAFKDADRLSGYRAGLSMDWISRGPDNVGGRTRGLVIDKDNSNLLIAGGVSGGIFRSTNGGKSWTKIVIDANAGGLIVSCMTQAPDGTIYFGTGEGYFNSMSGPNGDLTSGSRGGGIYKSVDRGITWDSLQSTDPSKSGNSRWLNVQSIKTDPTNASILYAATSSGFMKSTNAGGSWTRLDFPDGGTNLIFIDIAVSPDGQSIFTAAYGSGRCKLFRSVNGANFTKIAETVTQITNSTRLTLAIAPSKPNVVYVCSASNGTSPYPGAHCFGGLYRTEDNGDTWTQVVAGKSEAEPFGRQGQYQGQYDNCVGVDPSNPDRVFVGGVEFYCYKKGFWYQAASLEEFTDMDGKYKNPLYIHADKHNIIFDTKSTPKKMYVVSDGGIYVSENFSTNDYPTFTSLNLYYLTTQFYAIAVSPRGDIVGGTQDNNTIKIDYSGLTGNSGSDILGGDGFYTEISKYNPNIYFYESQEGRCYRSINKGKSSEGFTWDGTNYTIDDAFFFNTPFRLWEDKEKQTFYDTSGTPFDSMVHISKFFFAGQTGLWMTPDAVDFQGDSVRWYKISKGITQQILSIEYSSDGDAVFVGTKSFSNSALYRISGLKDKRLWFDGSGNFNPDNFGIKTELLGTWPSRSVCGIAISPSDDDVVIVTLGNYVNGLDHVYISTNALNPAASVTWKSIHGNLPRMPIYDAAINSQSNNQDTIVIATELGIWATSNGGNSWTEENEGIGRIPIFMLRQLKMHPWHKGYFIYAATHGMGIFECRTFCPNVGINDMKHDVTQSVSVYPNPVKDILNMNFNINQPSDLNALVFNIQGQVVKRFAIKNVNTGENIVKTDITGLKPGTYILKIQGINTDMMTKFLVID